MRNLAIIENGLVQNIIVIPDGKNGDKEIESRSGIEVTGTKVGIGWSYDGENFIEPEPTPEQLEARAKAEEKQAKLESAKAKLTALGLDEAEVQAILGL
jgi:hypothetical protein